MRKIVGGVLLALGGFLLVAAVLGVTYAPGVVKRTPIDVDTTTLLTGQAARLDTATGDFTSRPIYARSVTRVDSDVSTDDTNVFVATQCAVFGADPDFACVDGDDPNLITASIDTFAADRVTALATDSDQLPDDAVPHEGLVNKWPFDAEKIDYPLWDGTVGRAVRASYVETQDLEGLETYVYEVTIEDAPISIGEGIPGTFDDVKRISIDPRTGSIVNQVDDQQRYLADGTQVLDLQLGLTDDQISTNVAAARDNIATLDLITRTVPLVGFIGGAVLLAIGGLLFFGRRRRQPEAPAPSRRRQPVGADR